MKISASRIAASLLVACASVSSILSSVAQASWSNPVYTVSNRLPATTDTTTSSGGGHNSNYIDTPVGGTVKATFTWIHDVPGDAPPADVYVLEHGRAKWVVPPGVTPGPPPMGLRRPSSQNVSFPLQRKPRVYLAQVQGAYGQAVNGLGTLQQLTPDGPTGQTGIADGYKPVLCHPAANGTLTTPEVTLSSSATPPGGQYFTASWSFSAQIMTITMQNPTGDPTKAPNARLNANEFVFSQNPTTNFTEPGICLIPCVAAISPDIEFTRNWAKTNISWQVDNVGDSVKTWVDSNGAADDNLGLTANCKFTNLPTHSKVGTINSFGPKTVTMTTPAGSVTTTIEVFFPPYGRNHPGSAQIPANAPENIRSLNWFYYWKDALFPTTNAYFNNRAIDEAGEVPAMLQWSAVDNVGDPIDYDKTEVWINNRAALTITRADGSNAQATGIDAFANVMSHELIHVGQIAAADALVRTGVTPWERGWSWNVPYTDPRYNHYTLNAYFDLDTDRDDMPNIMDNTNGNAPNVPNVAAVELPARAAETIANDHHKSVDWSSRGKNYQSTRN